MLPKFKRAALICTFAANRKTAHIATAYAAVLSLAVKVLQATRLNSLFTIKQSKLSVCRYLFPPFLYAKVQTFATST